MVSDGAAGAGLAGADWLVEGGLAGACARRFSGNNALAKVQAPPRRRGRRARAIVFTSGLLSRGAAVARSNVHSAVDSESLLRRCIVPLSIMNIQARQPGRRNQPHLQFTPVPVVLHLRRAVTNHILVAELGADTTGDISHVAHFRDAEHASAGHLADVVEEDGAGLLLDGGGVGVEDADGVNLDVALTDDAAEFVFGVAAAVVAAVGDDEQRLALVL